MDLQPEQGGGAGVDLAALRVVFVDDEPANCRLGLRMLVKLGVARDNITVLVNGESVGKYGPGAIVYLLDSW